jgi:hypothetical protein
MHWKERQWPQRMTLGSSISSPPAIRFGSLDVRHVELARFPVFETAPFNAAWKPVPRDLKKTRNCGH